MKKIFALVMVMMMALSMVACTGTKDDMDNDNYVGGEPKIEETVESGSEATTEQAADVVDDSNAEGAVEEGSEVVEDTEDVEVNDTAEPAVDEDTQSGEDKVAEENVTSEEATEPEVKEETVTEEVKPEEPAVEETVTPTPEEDVNTEGENADTGSDIGGYGGPGEDYVEEDVNSDAEVITGSEEI